MPLRRWAAYNPPPCPFPPDGPLPGDPPRRLRSRRAARCRRHGRGVSRAVPLLAGVVVPVVRNPPPYNFGDIKPVMSALRDAATPTTAIYVHANAGTPFDYYAPRFGFERATYDLGTCHFASGDLRDFLREIDRYRGAPDLWVVIAHMTPGVIGQRHDLLRSLDAIGIRRCAAATRARSRPAKKDRSAPRRSIDARWSCVRSELEALRRHRRASRALPASPAAASAARGR